MYQGYNGQLHSAEAAVPERASDKRPYQMDWIDGIDWYCVSILVLSYKKERIAPYLVRVFPRIKCIKSRFENRLFIHFSNCVIFFSIVQKINGRFFWWSRGILPKTMKMTGGFLFPGLIR